MHEPTYASFLIIFCCSTTVGAYCVNIRSILLGWICQCKLIDVYLFMKTLRHFIYKNNGSKINITVLYADTKDFFFFNRMFIKSIKGIGYARYISLLDGTH